MRESDFGREIECFESKDRKRRTERMRREKKEKKIGWRNMNHLLMTIVVSISGVRKSLAKVKKKQGSRKNIFKLMK